MQIEEFLKWAFAQELWSWSMLNWWIGDRPTANLTEELLVARGDEWHLRSTGGAVPTAGSGETYFKRPVFYCAENDRVLFYHGKRKQWSIFWQTSTWASARLKTSRGPHMAQEGETWSVYDGGTKKFVKDAGMKCRLLTVEEQVAMAPEHIELRREQIKKCWFLGTHGLGDYTVDSQYFKKSDEVYNDRPVYKRWHGTRFSAWTLWYDATQKVWKETLKLGVDHCKVVPMRSEPTNAMAPHLTPFLVQVATRTSPLKLMVYEKKLIDNPRDEDVDKSADWPRLVLKAVEVEGLRFVQSRNPWGSMEWNGPWSDRCDEWAANPTIAEALGVDLQFEGSFWMEALVVPRYAKMWRSSLRIAGCSLMGCTPNPPQNEQFDCNEEDFREALHFSTHNISDRLPGRFNFDGVPQNF
eukprot:Skav213093  [mRNA]  locus=scaffold512:175368:184077:- [translate_table: standard]